MRSLTYSLCIPREKHIKYLTALLMASLVIQTTGTFFTDSAAILYTQSLTLSDNKQATLARRLGTTFKTYYSIALAFFAVLLPLEEGTRRETPSSTSKMLNSCGRARRSESNLSIKDVVF